MLVWSKVTHPIELGGLGIPDLTTLGYALHLRWWEWLARAEPDHLWSSISNMN
jgi:hypothetical protein